MNWELNAARAAANVTEQKLRDEIERLRALLESECRRAEDAHGEAQRWALEVERLRADHIAAHRVSVLTIQYLERELLRPEQAPPPQC